MLLLSNKHILYIEERDRNEKTNKILYFSTRGKNHDKTYASDETQCDQSARRNYADFLP